MIKSFNKSIKLVYLTLLTILISSCDQQRDIELEKISDAYIINSSQNPIPFWAYPGARNLGNVYTSLKQDVPLFELPGNEAIKVEVINFYATTYREKLFHGDATFEISENVCSRGERSYRNEDTCYFKTGSKYHFVKFIKDEVEYKGWIARTYLFKDLDGIVFYSPNSQGKIINLNVPRYSVSPQISDSKNEYCSQLQAAVMLSNLKKAERGEFETQDEFKDRVDSEKKLILNEGWKDKIYVTASTASLNYEIDTQQMSFKISNGFGSYYPEINFRGYGSYSGCDTPYTLDFTASVTNKTYGSFSAKGDKNYKYLTYAKKMDRNAAQLLKESLTTADKSIISYIGVKLTKAKSGFNYSRKEGRYPNQWTNSGSVRSFSGEMKYIILINPLDGSLVASYFSQDYINNYLNNDIAVLSASLVVDPINSGGKEDFVSLLHKKM